MQDFEQEILACVKASNVPNKTQVERLCLQAHASANASEKLQETLFSRLKRHKELKLSNPEIEHILVVLRQCCFIAPQSFVEFFRSRLYIIASFCTHKDPLHPNEATRIEKAAMALSQLLRDDPKLKKERSNSSFSPPSPSIWLPTDSPAQSPREPPLPSPSPRTRELPLLYPSPRRSPLPTPKASPLTPNSSLAVIPEENSMRKGHKEGLIAPRQPTMGEEITKKIRQLLNRPLSELQDSRSTLREIAQATFDETALSAIINLCLAYISKVGMENDELIKVLNIMKHCLKRGSPEYLSALRDQRDVINQLKDKFHLDPRLGALVRNILESLGQTAENQDLNQLGLQLLVESPLPQIHLPDQFSTFIAQIKLKDLTPFVELKDPYPFSSGGYANVYSAKLVTNGNESEDVAKKVLKTSSESNHHRHFKRLAREINAWAGLKHSNVGLLYGFTNEGNDRIGLISPYYKNGDIVKYIPKNISSNREFLNIMRGIALGVEYLHKKGIIHGDIKGVRLSPQAQTSRREFHLLEQTNIMMGDDNQPRLIDFGISRIVGVRGYTTTGNGTSWAWAAPELLQDDGTSAPKTQKSDIYALASTFVEMMTGTPPLVGSGHPAVAVSKGKTPERPMSHRHKFYPGDRLWNHMRSCWEKAESRPKANEVAKFLNKLKDIKDD